jgi:probable HAF family extracellular repeat protein
MIDGGTSFSGAVDINNVGIVVGEAYSGSGNPGQAFLDPGFTGQAVEQLPAMTVVQFSPAIAKNGNAVVGQTQAMTAWVRPGAAGSSVFSPGTLGGTTAGAFGVNSGGVVVGGAATASGATHAFRHPGMPGGTMVDLGTLTGTGNSSATDINDAGVIVGSSGPVGDAEAFILTPGGTMRSLGQVSSPGNAIPAPMRSTSRALWSVPGWFRNR